MSAPISAAEQPFLAQLGAHMKGIRLEQGLSRADVANATGLNPKTVYRIEVGARRTRARTIRVIAEALSDEPDALVEELHRLAGSALAPESRFVDRVERRRLKRLRRIEVLGAREGYAARRAAVEAEWRERSARHLHFRTAMRHIDVSFRQLRRLGML